MKQIDRLYFIIENLRVNPLTIHDLKKKIEVIYSTISLRQIQRDLVDVEKFLSKDESIKTFRRNYLKFYTIQKNNQDELINKDDLVIQTNFYKQKLTDNHFEKYELIKTAIKQSKSIIITNLINDETGDNFDFTTTNISFIPLRIINHRNTFYVGGFNNKKKCIQIFGINQLEAVLISKNVKNQLELIDKFNKELEGRFGVTKNINTEIYNIKIEISAVLAEFIKNHYWHTSQKFSKKNGNTKMILNCGINRELMGWLFQWMYNIRIIEPNILKDYYERTIKEIQNNAITKNQLVCKNIFTDKE
ncbi:MAG: WYL domain-containing protein [Flavobacteriaceae bacterium]|nr:WYL domain-containing protein [Flavobacteriaceae bacterium]